MDYERWCSLSDSELQQQDIAEVSLNCAVGLPGSEGLDIPACLKRLDEWTGVVALGIRNALRIRSSFPVYDELSESEYKILTMYSALHRHLGMTPNVNSMATPGHVYDGSDSRDQFIHAVLMDGYPCNCCTGPVIFAAIGRRLGFPIKIVQARQHLFCRWDGPSGERFNIEATDKGYHRKPDEHYHTWPKPIQMEAVRRGMFLCSLTPREEVAVLFVMRGHCLLDNLRPAEATKAFCFACKTNPTDYFHRNGWMIASMMLKAEKQGWQIPKPQRAWEQFVYQEACDTVKRIQSNRRAKFDAIKDMSFQAFA